MARCVTSSPLGDEPRRHPFRFDEREPATDRLGHPKDACGQRLLHPVPGQLPPRLRTHLLHDHHAVRPQRARSTGQQRALVVFGQQVQHVGDRDRVPRATGDVAGIDHLERHVGFARSEPSCRLLALGDLGPVDVDTDHVPAGRFQPEIQGQQAVPTADLEHVAAVGKRGLDGRERTPPPPQPGVEAGGARRVREELDGTRLLHLDAPSAAYEPSVKPLRSTAARTSGDTSASSSSPHR